MESNHRLIGYEPTTLTTELHSPNALYLLWWGGIVPIDLTTYIAKTSLCILGLPINIFSFTPSSMTIRFLLLVCLPQNHHNKYFLSHAPPIMVSDLPSFHCLFNRPYHTKALSAEILFKRYNNRTYSQM